MKRGELKNVATAQYDFAALREKDDYVYVDKTDMLARLASKEKDTSSRVRAGSGNRSCSRPSSACSRDGRSSSAGSRSRSLAGTGSRRFPSFTSTCGN